ncbi:MAG: hypothetical protein C0506_01415 [Anaerolinea sp.]|nr:hypothetical protein [Anaerolinea sp.]
MSALRSTSPSIPCLDNGDRLSRAEFHRRYEAMPHLKKAELIEGVVYLGSPVRIEHSRGDKQLTAWLAAFELTTPDVEACSNASVLFDDDNEFQPDICLRRVAGGTSRVEDGYVTGPPELVVEIAASSVSRDLHMKKEVYRRHGVQEYIVWRVLDEALDWFVLRDGEYVEQKPDARGVIESQVFPGLRLAVTELLAGDFAGVLAEQQAAR